MKHQYESEILFHLMERDGFNIPSSVPPYESEIKSYLIEQVRLAYPKLTDYEAEWLLYNYTKHIPAEFPIETITNVTNATVNNIVPYGYKSAILKGSTKYRDIDTGDILDTFDETKNLELVSVKVPVLTTSNEDGTKTNILTVNEPIELRGIGDIKDELNCLTGEVTERIVKIVLDGTENWTSDVDRFELHRDNIIPGRWSNGLSNYFIGNRGDLLTSTDYDNYFVVNGYGLYLYVRDINLFPTPETQLNEFKAWLNERNAQGNPVILQYPAVNESIKTVDLSVVDENGNEINHFMPIEGTMHIQTDGEPIKPSVTMEIPVEATTQNLASFIEMEE